jgi:hypothetical protein
VNDAAGVSGVTAPAFQAALARAFATWEAVPTASVRYEFGGFTAAQPFEDDGRSTMGFLATPELDRVLAATSLIVDDATGEIVESDIFFNSEFDWSVSPAGENRRFDIESIAVHEIGHLNGLGHSAIGETQLGSDGTRRVVAAETVMFPIAYVPGNTTDRTLKADDVAGISDIYPDGDFDAETGGISGRVTRNGAPLYGAHVVAFSPTEGGMVGGLTSATGHFLIAGLSPGTHVLRVEPLDDAEVGSFLDNQDEVVLDFAPFFANRLVVAPGGGVSETVEIQVRE